MNAKETPCCGISLFVIALFAGLGATRSRKLGPRLMSLRPSQTWKMMASKADIGRRDTSFYQESSG